MKIFDPISKPYRIGDRIADRFEIHQILGGEGKSGQTNQIALDAII